MELEAIRCGLQQQMGADQRVQHLPRPADGGAGEGSGGVQPEVRAGVQPQQAEEPGRRLGECAIGPGEDGADGFRVLVLPGAQGVP